MEIPVTGTFAELSESRFTKRELPFIINRMNEILKENDMQLFGLKFLCNPYIPDNEVYIMCGEKAYKVIFEQEHNDINEGM